MVEDALRVGEVPRGERVEAPDLVGAGVAAGGEDGGGDQDDEAKRRSVGRMKTGASSAILFSHSNMRL